MATCIANKSLEQALLGDFPSAMDSAVIDSSEAHQNQMVQYLNNPQAQEGFRRKVLAKVAAERKVGKRGGG